MNLLLDIKSALMPELVIMIFIIFTTFASFLIKRNRATFIFITAFLGVITALIAFCNLPPQNYSAFYGVFKSNSFTIFFRALILFGTLITLLMSHKYVEKFGKDTGEYYTLILTATLGAMLLVGANDLILLFVALETLSLSSYALVGFTREDKLSNEAALKYLVIGGASSAVLLYGLSFLYGVSGTTNLSEITVFLLNSEVNSALILSLVFVLGGLLFKLSAVPFHSWAPDVYEGAPVPISAFLSVVSKMAGLVVFLNLIISVYSRVDILSAFLIIIAVLTMTIGNLMALGQVKIKRLMAYSSIAQVGYILAAIATLTFAGVSSALFYFIAYFFMNYGVWCAIEIFINKTGKDSIEDLAGVAYKSPVFAFVFTVCVLSLAGIPITAGFMAKFYLFKEIVLSGPAFTALFAVVLINTLLGIYYYLKLIKPMFLKQEVVCDFDNDVIAKSTTLNTALGLVAAFVIVIGFYAAPFLEISDYLAEKTKEPTNMPTQQINIYE